MEFKEALADYGITVGGNLTDAETRLAEMFYMYGRLHVIENKLNKLSEHQHMEELKREISTNENES